MKSAWFWIFMLVIEMIIPVSMLGFGRLFMKKAPGKINALYGYRTARSMKSKETWEFAHQYFGRLWYRSGLILLPLSVIAMLCLIGKSDDTVGTAGFIISMVQMVPLIGMIFPTERALKKYFDDRGNRRRESCDS